jgi:PIN domain nuclease of toxin-antitoxin system
MNEDGEDLIKLNTTSQSAQVEDETATTPIDTETDSPVQLTQAAPPSPPPPPKPPLPPKHGTYYMYDELVSFNVENLLFRVHKWFFVAGSERFRNVFEMSLEGKTDESAFILSDVTIFEFECLLDFIYGRLPAQPSLDQWIAILSASTHLKFDKIRERAISKLTRLRIEPVHRVVLAKTYHIDGWFEPAYLDLCQRAHSLKPNEAKDLGLPETVALMSIREYLEREREKFQIRQAPPKATLKGDKPERVPPPPPLPTRPSTPVWESSKTTVWTRPTEHPRFEEGAVRSMILDSSDLIKSQ